MSDFFKLTVLFTILVGVCPFAGHAQNRMVALTFDDLPGTHGDRAQLDEVTRKLLSTLTAERIPAIGFVNEGKLYRDGREDPELTGFLEDWLNAGMDLGNHTYSHVFIDQVTVEEYKKEVIRGERITRRLLESRGPGLTYFRHTQLRTGPDETYRTELNAFLKERGYVVAPVTIDNDEYIYAYCYNEAAARNDEALMAWIREEYLEYMSTIFDYYEELSQAFLGRELRQIMLLHANLLNADTLDELLLLLQERGYSFLSLPEALEDPAYGRPVVQSDRGLSWLHRWMLADGVQPPDQPAPSAEIMELFRH